MFVCLFVFFSQHCLRVEIILMLLQPKTINAFQRVKIDEVVFTDDKLKDNSYWAKV